MCSIFMCLNTGMSLVAQPFGFLRCTHADPCHCTQGAVQPIRVCTERWCRGKKILCHTGESNPCQYYTWHFHLRSASWPTLLHPCFTKHHTSPSATFSPAHMIISSASLPVFSNLVQSYAYSATSPLFHQPHTSLPLFHQTPHLPPSATSPPTHMIISPASLLVFSDLVQCYAYWHTPSCPFTKHHTSSLSNISNSRDHFISLLVGVLRLGHEQGSAHLQVQSSEDGVKGLQDVGIVLGQADVLGRGVRQHLVQEGALVAHGAAGGQSGVGLGHRWVAVLLLQAVSDDQEGTKPYAHPLQWGRGGIGHGRNEDHLQGEGLPLFLLFFLIAFI